MTRRALLAGHFTTIGDLESLEIVRRWLDDTGIPHDTAPYPRSVRNAMPGAVDLDRVDPKYTHLVVICGPFSRTHLERRKLDLPRFEHCVKIGVNLTMVEPLGRWNPFDVLFERDSDANVRPDLSLLEPTPAVPVVGRCLVHRQDEYGDRQRHADVARMIHETIERRNFAVIDIDTCWVAEDNALRTSAHVVSVLKRVDLLLTNRLHGLVFALKSGVPAIAIDGIAGGDKVTAQARCLGWPMCIPIEEATPEAMDRAVDWCLSAAAGERIRACVRDATASLQSLKDDFLGAMTGDVTPAPWPREPGASNRGFVARLLRG